MRKMHLAMSAEAFCDFRAARESDTCVLSCLRITRSLPMVLSSSPAHFHFAVAVCFHTRSSLISLINVGLSGGPKSNFTSWEAFTLIDIRKTTID